MSWPGTCPKCGAELPAFLRGFCPYCYGLKTETADSSSGAFQQSVPKSTWVPNISVSLANSGEMVIRVELAGLTRQNLEITIEGHQLRIHGQRPDEETLRTTPASLIAEIPFGPFDCVLPIPPEFDIAAASAAYQNGILRVTVPSRK